MIKKIELIDMLAELVAFKSVTPLSAGSLEYIAKFVEDLGGSCIYVDRNQTSNLIASIGTGSEIFAFAGHVDVVPTGDITQWVNQDPFTLHQVGDKLIGRGVADMKGSIAAFMGALANFVAENDSANYQIKLLITSDEEGSAVDGTPLMVEYLQQNSLRLNYCLVGEPSCVSQLGDTVKVGRRGSLTGELVIHGKQGHIAYPHLCLNPIHSFAPALAELSTIIWDNGNQYFPATSLQFANLNSGLGVTNVIPGQLKTNFNFRYNTEHNAESLQSKVDAVLQKYSLDYSLSWNHSARPFMTQVGKLVASCSVAIEKTCGITPELKTDGGTSDGRFLIAVSDELIEFGVCNDSIHQINETTTLSDITNLEVIYYSLLNNIFAK